MYRINIFGCKISFKHSILIFMLASLGACGGGSDEPPNPPVMASTGMFLDSPVINIGYRTETLEGVTNSLGEFDYLPGETVTFFIGVLEFPPSLATGIITPLDLAGVQNTSESKVINMIRLLQTLDQDGNADNGITITDTAKASATQVDFNLTKLNFQSDSAVTSLIINGGQDIVPTGLISTTTAIAQFEQELSANGITFDTNISLINGSWKSICEFFEEETGFVAYEWNTRTFNDGQEHIVGEVYDTPDCSGFPQYSGELDRSYEIGGTLTADTGELVYEIDFISTTGEVELDIVYINTDTLNFGDGALAVGVYPTDLDFEYIYRKVITRVLADNFDSGALAAGVWQQSLDGVRRTIQSGRLVTTVTSIGPRETVNTEFTGDHTYMETTVRISSASTITVGARGRAQLAGYFYNDRYSGSPYNGWEGDVWAKVAVNLFDDGTLSAYAFIGPDAANGMDSIDTFLSETFTTSVQLDTDYVMSIEHTADGRLILTFNGESFIYQETGPMYPISTLPKKKLQARIFAGGTGGNLIVEWDDVYINAP